MEEQERLQKRIKLNGVFVPTQPISEPELFAGRSEVVRTILKAIAEPGRHIILYGERGVGKTSLANIVPKIFTPDEEIGVAIKVTANTADTFSTIWHNLAGQLGATIDVPKMGFGGDITQHQRTFDDVFLTNQDISPTDVVRMLSHIEDLCVFIIDEFDRIQDPKTKRLFADTVKALSDNLSLPTLLIVGVARDVTDLIGEHASIERNITQVELPRMSHPELREIIDKRLGIVGMYMDEEVVGRIVLFSQGYPHYTHLLAKAACLEALSAERLNVTPSDLRQAITTAIDETAATIHDTYMRAVTSSKESLFPDVLLACALARVDDDLSFRAVDITEPLDVLTGKHHPPQTFAYHLGQFCTKERGEVLETIGARGRQRYRFRNPMLRPYLILRASGSGRISEDALDEFLARET